MLDKEDIAVFEKAAELGIHRTVHAGEAGPAKMVMKVQVPNFKLFQLCRVYYLIGELDFNSVRLQNN